MLIYKNNPTLPQGGPDIGLKVGILAEIGNMLHECAVCKNCKILNNKHNVFITLLNLMKFFNFILFQDTSLYKFKQNEHVIDIKTEKNKEIITV